ncbi:hypothetical protein GX48_04603 [Paracoccidioides brasiliensis]|nr:hypothetical protein GX48_04603 [Paracoccidioides brasiliensis]
MALFTAPAAKPPSSLCYGNPSASSASSPKTLDPESLDRPGAVCRGSVESDVMAMMRSQASAANQRAYDRLSGGYTDRIRASGHCSSHRLQLSATAAQHIGDFVTE